MTGDRDAPSNHEAGKMGSRDTSNRDGPDRKKTGGIKAGNGKGMPSGFQTVGRTLGSILTGKKPSGSQLVFAGETEAEAAARRAAGGQGQRPEDFKPGTGSKKQALADNVDTQIGGFARQMNVGLNTPRTNRIGGKRNTQSGLSISGI